jgi:hypothetical protein
MANSMSNKQFHWFIRPDIELHNETENSQGSQKFTDTQLVGLFLCLMAER